MSNTAHLTDRKARAAEFRAQLARENDRVVPLYRVQADAEIGEWIGEPDLIGEINLGEHYKRADTERTHYDTFEVDGSTCAVEVNWATE